MSDILVEAKAWLYRSRYGAKPLESERLIAGLIAEVVRLAHEGDRLRDEVADAKKWAMSERGMKYEAWAAADAAK